MVLVVPGVCRYTVNQTMAGQEVANVLDVHIDTITGGREDHVVSVARQIINAWTSDILPFQDTVITANNVSWVDLDSATGSIGQVVDSGTITWPETGAGIGNSMPGGVAMIVRKVVTAERGARNGRMYIAAIPESWTDDAAPNHITAANVTTVNGFMASFLSTINSGEAGYDATLAVVRANFPAPDEGVFHDVLSLSVDPLLGTQRRRQR